MINVKNIKFSYKLTIIIILSYMIIGLALAPILNNSLEKIIKENTLRIQYAMHDELEVRINDAESKKVALINSLEELLISKAKSIKLISFQDEISVEKMKEIASKLELAEINIVDENGIIVASNLKGNLDWEYPEEHKMYPVIIKQKDKYSEPMRKSQTDDKYYKYSGIYLDDGYSVQVGMAASKVKERLSKIDSELDTFFIDYAKKHPRIIYAMTLNNNGTGVLGYEDYKGETFENDATVKVAIEGEESYSEEWIDGDIKANELQTRIDSGSIATGYKLNFINDSIFRILKDIFIIIIPLLLVLLVLIIFIIKKLFNPVYESVDYLSKISKGDFKVSVNENILNKKGIIGQIGKGVNNLVKSLSDMILDTKKTSKEMEENFSKLNQLNTESSDSMEQINLAVEEVAQAAVQQANDSQEIMEEVKKLDDSINKTKDIVNKNNEKSEEISSHIEENVKLINDSFEINENLKNSSLEIKDHTVQTVEASKEISELIEFIDNIAEQTNLLALNASIEAARAGEAGKGFAVVADEIRKLAEEVSNSVQEIDSSIISMQKKIKLVNNAVDNELSVLDEQVNTIENLVDKSDEIDKSLTEISETRKLLDNSFKNIEEVKDNVYKLIEGISAATEETSASSEEVSSTVSNQEQIVKKIADLSKDFKGEVENIKENLEKFNI